MSNFVSSGRTSNALGDPTTRWSTLLRLSGRNWGTWQAVIPRREEFLAALAGPERPHADLWEGLVLRWLARGAGGRRPPTLPAFLRAISDERHSRVVGEWVSQYLAAYQGRGSYPPPFDDFLEG